MQKEANDSEDIMFTSITDYYILWPVVVDAISLAEFASIYKKKGQKKTNKKTK